METNRDWMVMFQVGVEIVQGLRAKNPESGAVATSESESEEDVK